MTTAEHDAHLVRQLRGRGELRAADAIERLNQELATARQTIHTLANAPQYTSHCPVCGYEALP